MRFSSLSLATVFVVGAALPAAAATLSVPSKAYPTIQKAVSAAKPGDTVLVSAKPGGGVYNEAVTITTPGIVLQGKNNPIIDGTGLGVTAPAQPPFAPVTTYPSGIDIRASHVAVRGLTVQNTGGDRNGGGSGINAGYFAPAGNTYVGFSDIEISGVTARNNYVGITVQGYAGGNPFSGGTVVSSKGYRLLGDVVTGSTRDGADIVGVSGALISGCRFVNNGSAGLSVGTQDYSPSPTQNVLVAGNVFSGNYYDGLDTNGDGLVVTANEAASNGYAGMSLTASLYNPAVKDPAAPNPPASAVSFNSVHDNEYHGLNVSGTMTVSGNLLRANLGYGLHLKDAEYSTVSYNLITGTLTSGYDDFDGTGLCLESNYSYLTGGQGGFVTITGNVITGSAGDGVFLSQSTGCTLSRNDVSGSAGVGIHLDDYPSVGDAPNTVTGNRALRNTLFDARDDADAPDDLTYPSGRVSYGDNGYYGPTVNVWTKNTFGTTDPVGLSK